MNIFKNKFTYLVLFLLIVFLCFFDNRYEKGQKVIDGALDTTSQITVIAKDNCSEILNEISDTIYHYDALFSPSNLESDVFKINQSSNEPVKVSKDSLYIIDECEKFYTESEKKFDITVGALYELWSDAIKKSELPDEKEIDNLCALTDYSSLIIDKENQLITKTKSEQHLSFGAVAKGYITDKIRELLIEKDVHGALINLGGNVYAHEKKEDGSLWRVGILDPNNTQNVIGNISVSNKFVITSGSYERFFECRDTRYHHIINAKTGYPENSGILSVTVISDNGFLADALSTVCFLEGKEKSIDIIKKYDVLVILVDNENNVYFSSELDDNFIKSNENYNFLPI